VGRGHFGNKNEKPDKRSIGKGENAEGSPETMLRG